MNSDPLQPLFLKRRKTQEALHVQIIKQGEDVDHAILPDTPWTVNVSK